MPSRKTRPTLNPISGGGEMGKYMKKSKTTTTTTTTTATANEVSPTSSLGVRTRARTLALQQRRLQQGTNSSSPPTPPSSPAVYLQLRNRRLLKSLVARDEKEKGENGVCSVQNPNPNPSVVNCESAEDAGNNAADCEGGENGDDGVGAAAVEACFGENVLDSEARGRSTRESTPCSLIRNSDSIHTPGSTTRPVGAAEAIRRSEGSMRRRIPTTQEIEEFFAGLEKQQQKQFIEKYNFDPVDDTPLPGRFEWEVL
ncbi:hypothetical protein Drorol1_Dr00012957 [Drosera rotundifolia]